ncbi:MAG: DUF4139 domain-containing protein [Crocinitomicaceae bacterium]
MKKIILSIFIASMFGGLNAAEKEKEVNSSINEVTVFLQGAQVRRKASVYVEKGISKIILSDVTQYLDKNNIQVKGNGNFIILDVSHRVFYPVPKQQVNTGVMPKEVAQEYKLVEDSMSISSWKLKKLRSQLEVYNSERQILLNSGVIKGQKDNDSMPLLKDALEYYRIKLMDINKLSLELDQKIEKEDVIMTRLTNRLNQLKNWQNNVHQPVEDTSPKQQIVVTVSADQSTSGSLTVSYMTQQAGWTPAYDLRADDVASPVKITYKAKVFQNTGKDWDNVDVTLSTINPNRSNVKPTLAPWYINYYQPIQHIPGNNNMYYGNGVSNQPAATEKMVMSRDMNDDDLAKHLDNYTEMQSNMTMVEFKLNIKHSIPADGQEHLMAVASKSIPSTYEYFAAPKIEREAFLIAKLTDWEDLNLLPAVANIFFDGTYVGQTRIAPSSIRDTMELALGRDQRVVVERKRIEFEEKIKKVAGEKIATMKYQIIAKNLNLASLKLNIMDQIPLAANEEIKVELLDKGGAEFKEEDGLLKWVFELGAKTPKKLYYEYSVKYDKDKEIVL